MRARRRRCESRCAGQWTCKKAGRGYYHWGWGPGPHREGLRGKPDDLVQLDVAVRIERREIRREFTDACHRAGAILRPEHVQMEHGIPRTLSCQERECLAAGKEVQRGSRLHDVPWDVIAVSIN